MSPICVPRVGDTDGSRSSVASLSCPGAGVLPPPWAGARLSAPSLPAAARAHLPRACRGSCRRHRATPVPVRKARRSPQDRVAAARQKPPTGASDTAHLQLSSPPVADPQRLLGRAFAPRAWRKGAHRRGAFPGGFADHSVRFDALLGIAWRPNRRADMLTQPILDGATIGTLLAPAPSRRAGMRARGRAPAASGKAGHGRRQP